MDDTLLEHPAVAQAITFAVPHVRLGEDVAAAVVLRSGAKVSEASLRDFALARLAAIKVPTRIVIVDEIPKGLTGKPQRLGLADQLAALLQPAFVEPRSPTEQVLARIWIDVLGRATIGVYDNFFSLGGDSLMATAVLARISSTFQVTLTPATLFRLPRIAELASLIEQTLLTRVEALPEETVPSNQGSPSELP